MRKTLIALATVAAFCVPAAAAHADEVPDDTTVTTVVEAPTADEATVDAPADEDAEAAPGTGPQRGHSWTVIQRGHSWT